MLTIPFDERRFRPTKKRLFERRERSGEDARLTQYFDAMSEKQLQAHLDKGLVGHQTGAARRSLKNKRHHRTQKHLYLMAPGFVFVLALFVTTLFI